IAYLDNAATSQKPKQVIEAVSNYYKKSNANVHRGIHTLSVEATEMMEGARKKVAKFVGVKDPAEIVFVRNATEAINLVAYSWGRNNIGKGDEIVLTVAEHHSNFVVWQQLALENGAILKIVSINKEGQIDLTAFKKAITRKTKLVTFFHVSNVLGTINDVQNLSSIIHNLSPLAKILIDGAQAVPHMSVDISKMGCDFYVFTGHKMLGPTGIGVLWGRRNLLEEMPPFLFGGEMISKVSFEKSSWNELPWKFEAGTPDIAGAVGLGAAVDYLNKLGMENVRKHEIELVDYAISKLSKIEGVVIYGPMDAKKRGGVVAFNVGSIHAHDVASILDSDGIAIRSGHHCAQPLMEFLQIKSAARASFYIYNLKEEVDRLVEGILKVKKTFKI
ncbi:MAG: cysteine desulfurase, partial [Candidatus Curtissbacteria bacterium]|nr:cysteine desulfurase [Candidatus Curtissbacteria bacterium]